MIYLKKVQFKHYICVDFVPWLDDIFVSYMYQIISRDVTIEDSGGREYPARSVYKHSIEYLKKHFYQTMEKRSLNLEPRDIKWVLTVPVIWNEPAKQFMREAAVEVLSIIFVDLQTRLSD